MNAETFPITYRPIKTKDMEMLKRFTDRWIGEGYFTKEQLREACIKGIKEDLNAGFIATVKEKIVGVRISYAPGEWINKHTITTLSPGAWGIDIPDVAYFKSMFVHERFQQQGIGSKLSRLSIEQLKLMGAKAIVCHAWVESPGNSSRKYLQKMGFKEINQHKNFWYFVNYQCPRCGHNERCTCTAAEMMLIL